MRPRLAWTLLVLLTLLSCSRAPIDQTTSSRAADKAAYATLREATLHRAHVWAEPAIPIAAAKLGENPGGPDTFSEADEVDCRFKPGGVSGTTPKFDCELANGKKVKIKYGRDNPEVFSEVAASRLLGALGFPVDHMYVVEKVRCFGCPKDPFVGLECLNNEGATVDTCFPPLDYSHPEEFDYAVIERPLDGRRIETRKERGWKWEELALVDAAAGGAPRAHVDAFRLLAVFLGHWDNKAKNQRLICLGEPDPADPEDPTAARLPCSRPLAMVQDLGATFGPRKLDWRQWNASPIWADAAVCKVSMSELPYGGSTFPDAFISEEGREFLASRLRQLSVTQVRSLFEGARVPRYLHRQLGARNVENWVHTFQNKVRAIVDRPPCPADPDVLAASTTH